MSAEERILNLFHTYWFEQRVFSLAEPEQGRESDHKPKKLNRITTTTATLMRKSHSDNLLSSKDLSSSESPNSVLGPHLQTILSGKEVESFDESSSLPEGEQKISSGTQIILMKPEMGSSSKDRRRRRRRRKSESKSLSELEFQEVKGFMDLGFVFSDEDKDSRLVSIIPGLQRKMMMGKNHYHGHVQGVDETASVPRPYLSEAWEFGEEEERVKKPLMDWRIPSFGNDIELKDHLKFWAHAVASTVR